MADKTEITVKKARDTSALLRDLRTLIVEARQEVAGDMIVNGGAMTWPLVFRTHTKLSMEE